MAPGEARFGAAVLSAPMMGVQLGDNPPLLARVVSGLAPWVGLGGGYADGPGEPLGASLSWIPGRGRPTSPTRSVIQWVTVMP